MRAELKRELSEAGLLKSRPVATYLKAALLFAMCAAAFAAFLLAPQLWMRVGILWFAIPLTIALIMLGHESGHGTISRNQWVNDFIGYATFPLLGGVSFTFWKYKHNLHHAHVNVDNRDPDVPIFPLAMTRAQKATGPGFMQRMQSVQMYVFWPLTLLTTFAFRIDGYRYFLGQGRRIGSRAERHIDGLCLLGHFAMWLVIPVAVFHVSIASVVVFYLAWALSAGMLLAMIFLPAHTPFPLYSSSDDNLALQLETSQNLLTNRVFSFLLIGLDHQVEHHLFPRMSHLSLGKAAPIVRAHCERHGLPYQEQKWGKAIWETTVEVHERRELEPGPQPARAA